jgi:hypothetical protein
MAEIEFKVEGMDELVARAKNADTVVKITVNEGFLALSKLVVPHLRGNTPVRSGKLARSTVGEILGKLDDQELEIRQAARSPEGVFYGYIVREGRGPVYAKKAKALHFFIGGEEFFRKSVGPAAPNPYHTRTLQELGPQIQEIVNRMGQRITAYLSGKGGI